MGADRRARAQELIDNDEANFADAGGFVSPGGISYIGDPPPAVLVLRRPACAVTLCLPEGCI